VRQLIIANLLLDVLLIVALLQRQRWWVAVLLILIRLLLVQAARGAIEQRTRHTIIDQAKMMLDHESDLPA
jgi:hypothetical protein